MHSPLKDFEQYKITIDIMTFIQPINSNACLYFSHFYKEVISVVWLALRHAVKFLPGRKSILPYAACFWVTLIQQITNDIWRNGLSRRFPKESNVRIVYFQLVTLLFTVNCGGLSCIITLCYTSSTSICFFILEILKYKLRPLPPFLVICMFTLRHLPPPVTPLNSTVNKCWWIINKSGKR